ncbi:MAG: PD-(D/E)XK nuclease family protein [Bacteroidaceae bacterium]|nr:PD-(D/E)XK nuclease family protein [Bacteroidaceae bacterium]
MPALNGTQTIVQSVIHKYLRKLLEYDLRLAPFTILGLEKNVQMKLPIHIGGREKDILIGGNIDRLDVYTSPQGVRNIRVVDYKTSDRPQKADSIDALFNSNTTTRPYHILQAMYYAIQVDASGMNPYGEAISPALFYISQVGEDYSPEVKVGKEPVVDFDKQYRNEYVEKLTAVIEELYDTETPFRQAATDHLCEYCDFRELCQR